MKYRFLTGDINWQTYGGKFISRKLNNTEFDYWLVMEVINLKEACGDDSEYTYHIQVCAIAPTELPEKELNSAWESMGMDGNLQDAIKQYGNKFLIEMISGYMGGALIWQCSGNNLKKLIAEARKQSDIMGNMLFGFAMDRYQNAIGSTGWDLLRGDILAGLNRMGESDDN